MPVHFLASPEDIVEIGENDLISLSNSYDALFPGESFACDLTLISLEEIQNLNRDHRNIDTPTDVLSFPTFSDQVELHTAAKDHEVLLGSVVIAREKAIEYGETLIQLTHHGLLHLMGEDHETNLTRWQAQEERILVELAKSHITFPAVTV